MDGGSQIISYVPPLLVRQLVDAGPTWADPVQVRSPGAVLFADISGFTALSEHLARQGGRGLEQLTHLLNQCFGGVVDTVTAQGGEVVRFAGDALLARWSAGEQGLEDAVDRAAACSLLVRSSLEERPIGDDFRLTMKMAVGAGPLFGCRIGGLMDRWEVVLAGAPLHQIAHLFASVPRGGVALSAEAWSLSRERYTGAALPEGGWLVFGRSHAPPPRPLVRPTFSPSELALLGRCVPMAIRSRLEARQQYWLAERRRVSVLFVNLQDLDEGSPGWLERTHQALQLIQGGLYQFGGSLDKVINDDKGTCALAAFGLPPMTTEDRASRALRSAVAIRDNLAGAGVSCAIGVASGYVVCGPIGNDVRREYTMIGDVVNLAARLMKQATRPDARPEGTRGAVLCDVPTWRAAADEVDGEALAPRSLPGMEEPVQPYLVRRVRRPSIFVPSREGLRAPILGREEELQRVREAVQALREGTSTLMLIEADAGMGKTRLTEEVRFAADATGAIVLHGGGQPFFVGAAYHVWKSVFTGLFDLGEVEDPALAELRVRERLEQVPDGQRFAPLLNAVLPLNLPETEATAILEGKARGDRTRDLLVALLQVAARQTDLVLALEDAQWFDSASWALLVQVMLNVHPVVVLVPTRPLKGNAPAELAQLLAMACTRSWSLPPLAAWAIRGLVKQDLGVTSLPGKLGDWIVGKSQGNPLFAIELTHALLDRGLLSVEDGQVVGLAEQGALDAIPWPETVEGIVTSRLNELPPEEQLLLKTASVLGPTFTGADLETVYPETGERPELALPLQHLVASDILVRVNDAPVPTWSFCHQVTLDTAYDLMLDSQRRHLHRAVARRIEAREEGHLETVYGLLAHHWTGAGEPGPALKYLDLAATQATGTGLFVEAIRFLEIALRFVGEAPGAVGGGDSAVLYRARLKRCLADAWFALGRMDACEELATEALDLLDLRVPASFLQRGALLVAWLFALLANLLLPHASRPGLGWLLPLLSPDADRLPWFAEGARSAERLSERYFFSNDAIPMLVASLQAARLAERAGPAPRVGRAYGLLAQVAAMARLDPVVRAMLRRGRALADAVDDLNGTGFEPQMWGLWHLGFGRWAEADVALQRSLHVFETLADGQEWRTSRTLTALACYYQGRFEQAAGQFGEILRSARSRFNAQHEGWGLYATGECYIPLGRFAEALELVEEARRVMEPLSETPSKVIVQGLLAVCHLRLGEPARAREEAERGYALIGRGLPTVAALLEGYAGLGEVFTRLAEQEAHGSERRRLLRRARVCVWVMWVFAFLFPIGGPRARLQEGRLAHVRGHRRRARFWFRQALRRARAMGMQYEASLALREVGEGR